jgi:hypothetical protein
MKTITARGTFVPQTPRARDTQTVLNHRLPEQERRFYSMTIDIPLFNRLNKDSPRKAKGISKIRLKPWPRLYIVQEPKGRGGRGLGRFHEITEMFIDAQSRAFVGFVLTDRSGHSYAYTDFGKWISPSELKEAV